MTVLTHLLPEAYTSPYILVGRFGDVVPPYRKRGGFSKSYAQTFKASVRKILQIQRDRVEL